MEIEKNKISHERVIRKLFLPKVKLSSNSKPGKASKNFFIGKCQFSFKSCLVGKQILCYRCLDRISYKYIIHIPVSLNYDISNFEFLQEEKLIQDHSRTCSQIQEDSKIEEEPIMIYQMKSDFKVLEDYIRSNPLLEPKLIKAEMLKRNQVFKKREIIKLLQEVWK